MVVYGSRPRMIRDWVWLWLFVVRFGLRLWFGLRCRCWLDIDGSWFDLRVQGISEQ